MKFLCVGHFDPVKMQALSPEAVEEAMRECPAHMDTMYGTDRVVLVAGADNETRLLRRAGGKLVVSDRETEAKAKIGCVFILEATDMDEAVRLAALHPTTQIDAGEGLGWYTEVRPVHYFYEDKDE